MGQFPRGEVRSDASSTWTHFPHSIASIPAGVKEKTEWAAEPPEDPGPLSLWGELTRSNRNAEPAEIDRGSQLPAGKS